MIIPKGNIIIEDEAFPFVEIEPMLGNLQADGFTGYVLISSAEAQAFIFVNAGQTDKAFSIDNASGSVSVYDVERLLRRLSSQELRVSSYVLSARMVSVLNGFFAFQQQYVEYEVKRREMKKVLEGLESSHSSGVIKVATREGAYYLLVAGGELLTDRFSRWYGEVICGVDEVKLKLEEIEARGATITVYAEKDEEIENRRRQKDDELEKIKDFMVKIEGGFLRSGDVVHVDDYAVREWGIDSKTAFNVEVETPTGEVREFKCQGSKKMGSYIGMTKAMVNDLGLAENEVVTVRPL